MAGCVQTWGHVKTGKIAEPNGISYRQEYDIWVQVQMQYNIYYIYNYIYITHTHSNDNGNSQILYSIFSQTSRTKRWTKISEHLGRFFTLTDGEH